MSRNPQTIAERETEIFSKLEASDIDARLMKVAIEEHLGSLPASDYMAFGNDVIKAVMSENGLAASNKHFDVMFQVLRIQKRWTEIEQIYSRIARPSKLRPPARLSILKAKEKCGHFDAALILAKESYELFPKSRPICRRYFRLSKIARPKEVANEIFSYLCETFKPAEVVSIVGGLKGIQWQQHEIDFFIDTVDVTEGIQIQRLVKTLAEVEMTKKQLDVLRENLAVLPSEKRTVFESIFLTAEDEADLNQINLIPISIDRFHERHRRLLTVLSDMNFSKRERFEDSGVHLDQIYSAGHHRFFYTRESYFDALMLASSLRRRITNGEATLFTRLGDGEGAFMRGFRAGADARDLCIHESIQKQWWNTSLSRERKTSLALQFCNSLSHADIIGLPPKWRMNQPFRGNDGETMRTNLVQTFENVQEACQIDKVTFTSAHANTDLQKWNLWRLVFNATDKVSFISCHDIETALREKFSLGTNHKIIVPGECKYQEIFGDERGLSLIDIHDDVIESISVVPGEVWLISAGFLGKLYADRVRELDGIAIDIGALSDYWIGHVTRDYNSDESIHNLPLSLVHGHGLSWHNRPVPLITPKLRLRSSLYFDAFDSIPKNHSLKPLEKKLFKIIGHPRCASGYIATVFGNFGYSVGHERLLENGICSWMLAVDDAHIPWGDNPESDQEFQHTLGYVRNPADAIPSIMLENNDSASFMFRRLHILRSFDVDIANYRSSLERACASLIYWDELVSEIVGGEVIRIENAVTEVGQFFGRKNLDCNLINEAPENEIKYNSSLQRFGTEKPRIDAEMYKAIDSRLLRQLEDFCAKYGYNLIEP